MQKNTILAVILSLLSVGLVKGWRAQHRPPPPAPAEPAATTPAALSPMNDPTVGIQVRCREAARALVQGPAEGPRLGENQVQPVRSGDVVVYPSWLVLQGGERKRYLCTERGGEIRIEWLGR